MEGGMLLHQGSKDLRVTRQKERMRQARGKDLVLLLCRSLSTVVKLHHHHHDRQQEDQEPEWMEVCCCIKKTETC